VGAGDADELQKAIDAAGPRGIVARGLGRSYGDAAQNAGGDVVVTSALDSIIEIDPPTMTAKVGAGVSLDRLMRAAVPMGLWPAVTPGTRHVTVGGAIAADVHGKNHHRDGTFGSQVSSMVLVTPASGPTTVSPDADPDVFWATTGGMGLTGIISEATVGLIPIETAFMRVDAERTVDLEATMANMAEADSHYRYSVCWIDCLATGRSLGRSIIELADHAGAEELPASKRRGALRFDPAGPLPAPPWAPSRLLNRWTVAAFNELWYRKSPKRSAGRLVPMATFFHPLDLVEGWNRIYGKRGFLQYQLLVPDGEEATLRKVIESFADRRCASFLAVLKRFGPSNAGALSFPGSGWTLALDMPALGPELGNLLDELDEQVAAAGGRIYLAKDSRLRPDLLEAMYPRLPEWRAVRHRVDPEGRMRSDLARRLPALVKAAPRGSPA
jgi:decaprenylphospho-beta-D-ribofuranose 2-oxidase